MYISLNWLKDFVKLPAKTKAAEIADQLTAHTVEVESFSRPAERFKNVVVGKVLEVKKHPRADKLFLTKVDIKDSVLAIVCGAPNVARGQLVAVALAGAVLANGLEIKAAEIRGEKSAGMICAADELGLGASHEGILVLEARAKVGQSLADYLGTDDTVLEVDNKSLSNRPDLWSHYGLARELAAIFDRPLKAYDKFFKKSLAFLSAKENKLVVKVEDKELCPRYLAVKVENISVGESPAWLQERLIAVGQRPINNIVDLTNYVMLECGQPLHAFDAARAESLIVRRAKKNESLETLDDEERELDENDLVITDGKKVLAIAGVMGGRASEIFPTTTALVLEAANFSAPAVRRTAQKLNLRTEASMRFEKSLDPELAPVGLKRFLTLLEKLCPEMKIISALIDVNQATPRPVVIDLTARWLARKIGQEIPASAASALLEKLGFKVALAPTGLMQVTVPSWRANKDVVAKEDLAEEILRLYGYDRVTSRLPVMPLTLPAIDWGKRLERRVKTVLALKYALSEVYNYSFVGAEQLKKLDIDFFHHLRLANPLADTQSFLRQSLVPGLLNNIKNNQAKAAELGFFEIGRVFFQAPGEIKKEAAGEEVLPYQEKRLGLVLAGANGGLFSRLKGLINNLWLTFAPAASPWGFSLAEEMPAWADKKAVAKIKAGHKEIGLIALVNPTASLNLNLKKAVAVAEINFSLLVNLILNAPPFRLRESAKYPAVRRDLAFVVDAEILYNDIEVELSAFSPLLKDIEIFDFYQGEKLPAGKKSLAFHLTYQAVDRTLTAAEVDKVQNELMAHLAKKFGAKLRDF